MSKMYVGQWWCLTTAQDANTNLNVTLASITDGTSNTAAVSESLVNDGSGNSPDGRRNLNYTNSGLVDADIIPACPPWRSSRTAWPGRSTGSPGASTRG